MILVSLFFIKNDTKSGVQNDTKSGVQNDTKSGAQNDTKSGAQNDTKSGAQNDTKNGAQKYTSLLTFSKQLVYNNISCHNISYEYYTVNIYTLFA
ncbi:hypothetical protein M3215_11825 [Bacillus cytotoxicus]|uniref:Uncharacterized protein n=1 Tax=Bacillus cytotoxicus TaxID=580165 RepID=A0ACC6A8C0_9BACI|nr:hypothetical protein [Bacillus cytotoxicus]